jgi:hypothetical protein
MSAIDARPVATAPEVAGAVSRWRGLRVARTPLTLLRVQIVAYSPQLQLRSCTPFLRSPGYSQPAGYFECVFPYFQLDTLSARRAPRGHPCIGNGCGNSECIVATVLCARRGRGSWVGLCKEFGSRLAEHPAQTDSACLGTPKNYSRCKRSFSARELNPALSRLRLFRQLSNERRIY